MTSTQYRKAISTFAAATLMFAAATVQAIDVASGTEIEASLSGNTLQGSGTMGAYAEYYDANGTIRGKGYTGKWKIMDDTGCMDYGEGFSCWTAFFDGAAGIWYRNGEVDAVSLTVPGNPNNF